RAAAQAIAPGSRLLVVAAPLPETRSSLAGLPRVLARSADENFTHLAALAVIDRSAFIPYLFTGWTSIAPTARKVGLAAHAQPVGCRRCGVRRFGRAAILARLAPTLRRSAVDRLRRVGPAAGAGLGTGRTRQLLRHRSHSPPMSTAPLKSYGLSLVGCAIAATLLVTASYAYLRFGAYLDHIEGGVVVSGWEYAASGTPLYQLQDGVPRFATYYGPLAYLVEDLAPLLFQPSIAVSKLASLLALFATIAIMAAHFLVRRQSQGAWGGLFYLLAGCLFFVPVSFWVRPDPFETLLVAAGVALAANPIALGLCIGLAVNFKIHAFIYFFPILVESLAARRWQSLAIVAASAMVAFALPFLAPGLSLHDYLAGLLSQIGGRHPSRADLAAILVPALLLGLPMAYPLVTQKRGEPDRVYALAALAALGLLFYPAAFPGAGPYH